MRKNIHGLTMYNEDDYGELADRTLVARDKFFTFVTSFDDMHAFWGPEDLVHLEHPEGVRFDSLWEFWHYWLNAVHQDLFWCDEHTRPVVWAQFLHLSPTIYLMICEAYDRDPSKLDLIQRDPVTGTETRIERRVKTKLPNQGIISATSRGQDDVDTSTDDGLERGIAMFLLGGAVESWPAVAAGSVADSSGPAK